MVVISSIIQLIDNKSPKTIRIATVKIFSVK